MKMSYYIDRIKYVVELKKTDYNYIVKIVDPKMGVRLPISECAGLGWNEIVNRGLERIFKKHPKEEIVGRILKSHNTGKARFLDF